MHNKACAAPEMPAVVLDVSRFRKCFDKDSDFLDFATAVETMVRQLSCKLSEADSAGVSVEIKLEFENE